MLDPVVENLAAASQAVSVRAGTLTEGVEVRVNVPPPLPRDSGGRAPAALTLRGFESAAGIRTESTEQVKTDEAGLPSRETSLRFNPAPPVVTLVLQVPPGGGEGVVQEFVAFFRHDFGRDRRLNRTPTAVIRAPPTTNPAPWAASRTPGAVRGVSLTLPVGPLHAVRLAAASAEGPSTVTAHISPRGPDGSSFIAADGSSFEARGPLFFDVRPVGLSRLRRAVL